ncbi:hypothetical protein PGT21_005925 [Puccinia graminis f. sp. tritici]|uniref:ELMO domain-containing protein n=1 Tax=Puccinia graminis f. sp. tritici TaxID=56615 RepID=A0A5B0N1V4_PUCGR|nr:hypothetical protein PGT21_005925 [Puccinia graminis f. sp. tritici]KAA1133589.1 hypothetical protein PGTUg99_025879 [Puccinia graminis f. sp. tritici]
MNFGITLYVLCSSIFFPCEAIDEILDQPHDDLFAWNLQPSNLDDIFFGSPSQTQYPPHYDHDTASSFLSSPQDTPPHASTTSSSLQIDPSQAHWGPAFNSPSSYPPIRSQRQALGYHQIENEPEGLIDLSTSHQGPGALQSNTDHSDVEAYFPKLLGAKRPGPSEYLLSSPAVTRLRVGTQEDTQVNHAITNPPAPSELRRGDDSMNEIAQTMQTQVISQPVSSDSASRGKAIATASTETANPTPSRSSEYHFPNEWTSHPPRNIASVSSSEPNESSEENLENELPNLRFTRDVLVDENATGNYGTQAYKIEELFDELGQENLALPEDEVVKRIACFSGRTKVSTQQALVRKGAPGSQEAENEMGPTLLLKEHYTTGRKKSGKTPTRYSLSKGTKSSFWTHKELWYNYWIMKTGVDFRKHNKDLQCTELLEIFPMYLFFVEMITTIIPRAENRQLSQARELSLACHSFFELLGGRFAGSKKEKYAALQQQIFNYSTSPTYFKLWAFLSYWIDINRASLMFAVSPEKGYIPNYFKTFFNTIFYISIEHFHKIYKKLNYFPVHREN